jgi:acylphosphatase
MTRSSAADIVVEGRVQGVGYRAWVERQAAPLGLVGYVMNLEDGRVRVWVEGDRSVIEELVRALARGPRLARVIRTDVRWAAPTHRYRTFAVRHRGEEA